PVASRHIHPVGGLGLASQARLPKQTETIDWNEWRFEVVDVDRNRVDQVLATPNAATHKSAI
ncbi:MAG: transporter associated domain-containing protein, partial [Limnobacter sp.]